MSKYEVSIDVDSRPKGDPIEVPPAGLVPNGGSVVVEIPDEDFERIKDSEGPVKIKKAAASAKLTAEEEAEEAAPEDEGGGET